MSPEFYFKILFCIITVNINLISYPYSVENETCRAVRGQYSDERLEKILYETILYNNTDNLSLSKSIQTVRLF